MKKNHALENLIRSNDTSVNYDPIGDEELVEYSMAEAQFRTSNLVKALRFLRCFANEDEHRRIATSIRTDSPAFKQTARKIGI